MPTVHTSLLFLPFSFLASYLFPLYVVFVVLSVVSAILSIIVIGLVVVEVMLGSVIIEHKGCDVGVGSGFDQEERRKYFKNPELIVGKTITVQYLEETTNQDGCHSLRFPVVKHVYSKGRDI